MKKALKIGIGAIAGLIGTSVLLHIHNAEVCRVYRERYGEGYDAGYAVGLYEGKRKGACAMFMTENEEHFNKYMGEAEKEFVEANTQLNK